MGCPSESQLDRIVIRLKLAARKLAHSFNHRGHP
ncbi:protease FtsH-inhibitory lysogeny factor CIII [Chimaeribacter californicus]|nr:protease FtsH-inhibitory lysogeny factor CIII [Chimaeribacter californicus]